MKAAHQLKLVSGQSEQESEVEEIFARRGEEIVCQFSRAFKTDNEEAIHDLRVAIRRFRTALKDLKPLLIRKTVRPLNKALKRLSARAGNVRDHDVAMKLLKKHRGETEDPWIIAGLDRMIGRRQDRRDRAFHSFKKHADRKKIEKVTEKIRSLASTAHDENGDLTKILQEVLTGRRADFLDLIPKIYHPFDQDGQHLLRMAAKALRYSLEISEDLTRDTDGPSPSEKIAKMQDHLGKVHDCDVWIDELNKGLRREYRKGSSDRSDFVAAEWLLGKLIKLRSQKYREALDLWTEWRTNGFLDKLCS